MGIPGSESRTFADYLLLPNLTPRDCTPDTVDISASVVKHPVEASSSLRLNLPMVSAAMQSVSDDGMAIALARAGGLAFVYSSQPIEQQAAMVEAVKRHKAGFVVSDSNVTPSTTIGEMVAMTASTGHSTVAVTADGGPHGELLGVITSKDFRPTRVDKAAPVADYMVSRADLHCARNGITIEDANDLIWDRKLDFLPILDDDGALAYFVFRKDYEDHHLYDRELVDGRKRLLVGAAVNTHDYLDRVPALVEAGADVLCLDSSDGYSEFQHDTLQFIRDKYGDEVRVGAGNVVDGDAFRYLVDAGADFVKIGVGGGAICITREQKGIGRGQASAVLAVAEERDRYAAETGTYVPICSDGGISQDYHVALALAMGADFVMMGRYFARYDESPSRLVKLNGAMVKEYWGEGTTRAANWARYHEGGDADGGLPFEEGADVYVPYAGKMAPNLASTMAKLRSVMSNCGARTLEEFRAKARFVTVSHATLREGGLHDVIPKAMHTD